MCTQAATMGTLSYEDGGRQVKTYLGGYKGMGYRAHQLRTSIPLMMSEAVRNRIWICGPGQRMHAFNRLPCMARFDLRATAALTM